MNFELCPRCDGTVNYHVPSCPILTERKYRADIVYLKDMFFRYAHHESTCLLEHYRPGIAECGCGYISAVRTIIEKV